MKIYVSEKEIKSINNTFADVYENSSKGFLKNAVPVKSLEQHDKELLRKIEWQLINYMPQNGGTTIEYLEGFHAGIKYAIKQINELLYKEVKGMENLHEEIQ